LTTPRSTPRSNMRHCKDQWSDDGEFEFCFPSCLKSKERSIAQTYLFSLLMQEGLKVACCVWIKTLWK